MHGIMMWWLFPLLGFLFVRSSHRRWPRRGGRAGGKRLEGDAVEELRRTVEDQRGYIEELEGRLARVEDGLEFAERLLAERGAGAASGAAGAVGATGAREAM